MRCRRRDEVSVARTAALAAGAVQEVKHERRLPIFDLRFCRCKRTHFPSAKIQS
jgi:hypothetical protein